MTNATWPIDQTAPVGTDLPDLAAPIPHREAAEAFVTRICFKIGPPRLLGLELEWLVYDEKDPTAPLDAARLADALGPLAPVCLTETSGTLGAGVPRSRASREPAGRAASPKFGPSGPSLLGHGSAVTVEPGGQIEVSTPVADSLLSALTTARADAAELRELVATAGLVLGDQAADPYRTPRRILHTPRYAAMEAQFDRRSPSGRTMMCSTAAVQPCLDAGSEADLADRWQTAHEIGPALVAIFANSPALAGRRTGWKSSRQAAWLDIDPTRTLAPSVAGDPREPYARFALDAPLLVVRRPHAWERPVGVSFADWLDGALDGRPTYADLAYHLTTLFPPVRAQGYFEIRYLDMQAAENWVAPIAVTAALLSTPRARDAAREAVAPVRDRWVDAARIGLDDPAIARAGRAVLAVALDTLNGENGWITDRVADFAERYTLRGRCPADDGLVS